MRWFLLPLILIASCVITYGRDADVSYKIMKDAEDSVFRAQLYNNEGFSEGWGTAFVVKHKGKRYTITAGHVCDNITFTYDHVYLKRNGKTWKVKVKKVSDKWDLCLLQNPKTNTSLDLSDDIIMNEYVYSIGFPRLPYMTASFGRYIGNYQWQHKADRSVERCKGDRFELRNIHSSPIFVPSSFFTNKTCWSAHDTHVATAKTSPGSSGGPILNSKVEVIGVTIGALDGTYWTVFVKLEDLRTFLENKE